MYIRMDKKMSFINAARKINEPDLVPMSSTAKPDTVNPINDNEIWVDDAATENLPELMYYLDLDE